MVFWEYQAFYRGLDSLSRLPVYPTNDAASACFHSWNSWCFCRVLEEWPAAVAASSSWAKETSFYWKPSINAQQSQVGDIYEMGTRIQSVFDTPHNIYLMPCTDSDIIHINTLGTSIVILNLYKVATNLLDKDPVSTPAGKFECLSSGKCFISSIRPHFTMYHML